MPSVHMKARTPAEVQKVVQELERQSKTKLDYVVPATKIAMHVPPEDQKPRLALDMGGTLGTVTYEIEDQAHEGIASKTKIPREYYRRMLGEAPGLLSANVNTWMERRTTKVQLVRTLDGYARAVLSSRFRTLDSFDLFFHAFSVAKSVGASILDADLTPNRFYMRIVHPEWKQRLDYQLNEMRGGRRRVGRDSGGDEVIPGISLGNSETGRGGMSCAPFLFRPSCANGMTMDDVLFKVHLGRDAEAGVYSADTRALQDKVVWSEVQDLVRATFDRDRFQQIIDQINGVATMQLPDAGLAVDHVVTSYGLTDEDRQMLLNELMEPSTPGLDPGRTVWGLINAVTSLANHESKDGDQRAELQRVGGKLLDQAEELVALRPAKKSPRRRAAVAQ